jgi:dihydrofolate reductase
MWTVAPWCRSSSPDLLDDLTISVVPVVLGDGIWLFQETRYERRLNLVGSEALAIGVVQLRYRLQMGNPAQAQAPATGPQ